MIKTFKTKKLKTRFSPLVIIMLAVLAVYSFFLIWLLGWGLLTALKNPLDFNDNMVGLPNPWYFKNFGYVLKNATMKKGGVEVAFGSIVWNSVIYSVGCALVNTIVLCVTAYLCARYLCWFSKFLYAIVLVVMTIPIVGNQISELEISIKLGLYDTWIGMLVMRANFLGLYFLVFYEMFKGIPRAFSEAAEIDGAGDWQIMLQIFFPMVSNTFITVVIINFIQYWNNYQVPMVFVPTKPTLAEYMFYITTLRRKLFGFIPCRMAAAFLLLLPVVVLFLAFNKKLLGNLSIGGIKG